MRRAWRLRRTRAPAAALALSAAGLYVAQVFVGAANVWTRLAVGPVVAHVALSSLIWACLVGSAAASRACSTAREVPSPEGRQERGFPHAVTTPVQPERAGRR